MIKGVGIDIVSVKRIKKAISKKGFVERFFSENEIQYCEKFKRKEERYAGKFSAKEAFIKAVGKKDISLKEIEILNDSSGKPYISCKSFANETFHLSISHEREYAISIVIWEA